MVPCLISLSTRDEHIVTIVFMADHDTDTPRTGEDLLKHSTLYREFQAEREEILRHKWIESEKAGHDIGFERALVDWIMHHRAAWRQARIALFPSY